MVTAPLSQPTKLTPEEYFTWEEKQELRYEYFDGEVFAMTGGTVPHGLIGVNLTTALKSQLRGRGCLVLIPIVRLRLLSQARSPTQM